MHYTCDQNKVKENLTRNQYFCTFNQTAIQAVVWITIQQLTTRQLIKTDSKLLNPNFRVLILFCLIVYGLAIFQDYLFSKFRSTGFYWSDTMLYNLYWLLFIPIIFLARRFHRRLNPNTLKTKALFALGFGVVLSSFHIIIFTLIFIIGSHLIFPVPHRFSTILKNAISNQSQITLIIYLIFPFFMDYLNRKKQQKEHVSFQPFITIKNGTRRVKIDSANVIFIQTDRPYTAVFSTEQKLLHDESLKTLEEKLDPQVFIRVHRSVIINKNHITEIVSRKNGDYDGVLTNGQSIRFSRHYRHNWNTLLNH